MTDSVSTYLTYANLQMAAEAMLDRFGNVLSEASLDFGNNRSSKTPKVIADQLIADGWTVAAHLPNMKTGLSATLFKNKTTGEYVMSIRSTEFLDDAVRDNKATNELEIKATGFAIGQLADLEKWYQETVKSVTGGQPVTVTGYSLGGHLATAFEQMHRSEVAQVYTFNGAGIGSVKDGYTLSGVVAQFQSMRSPDNDLSYLFNTSALRELYLKLRESLRDGKTLVTDKDIAEASALADSVSVHGSRGQVIWQAPQTQNAVLLRDALKRIKDIQDYAAYVAGISDGSLPPPLNKPAAVPAALVEATDLNYQLAVLTAAAGTKAMSAFDQAWNLYGNYGPHDDLQANIHDVTGASYPSMVSNSQYHHGMPTPFFIEDQPLARGSALAQFFWQSDFLHADIKLLYPNFSQNDFGDTHSLVLLQDSLSVQQALARLDPTLTASAAGELLKAASNSAKSQVPFTQGRSDGDTLEKAVDSLTRLFVDPNAAPIGAKTPKGHDRNDGGTWAEIEDRNQNLQAALQRLVGSSALLASQAQVRLTEARPDLAGRAQNDFSALATLLAGSPIAITPTNDAAKQTVELALASVPQWDEAYTDWVGDLGLSDKQREAGLANFSDAYLGDRAAYVSALARANQANASMTNVTAVTPQPFTAFDVATQALLTVTGKGLSIGIQFGAASEDALTGGAGVDHLYGAGGADDINGGGGNDRLEGNDGDDQLDGGAGADTLLGGWGDDVYVFDGAHGVDRVIDKDDKGSIQINGAQVTATRSAGNNTWVSKTDAGELVVLEVVDDSKSLTGKSLSIHAASGFDGNAVFIENFDLKAALTDTGYLGIKLENTRALVIAKTDADNPFDVQRAWDFDKDSVQTVTSEAAERNGDTYTIYLNQAAQAGDTLRIAVKGNEGMLRLLLDGEAKDITGEVQIELAEGQTELSFTLVGGSDISADQVYGVTATWVSAAALGANQGAADEPAVSNRLELTLKDSGEATSTYLGDQRAPLGGLTGHDYDWGATHWDTQTGELVGGVAQPGFSDVIEGSALVDHIEGKGGNDALDGGDGKDQIDGGDGDDLIGGGKGSDYIQGGAGNDMILSATTLVVSRQTSDDDLWKPPEGKTVWTQGDTWGVYEENDQLYIIDGGGPMPMDDAADIVEAGDGDDRVIGGQGDDMQLGQAGNDRLTGVGGDDALAGGEGNDTLSGDGIDRDGYYETLLGAQHGRDQLDGGMGDDTMSGDGSDDALQGGDGADWLYGDTSLWECDFDGLDGSYHGDDEMDGGAGNDTLAGDGGSDILLGGGDDDHLSGDGAFEGDPAPDEQYHGQDTLDGGDGNDVMWGDGRDDALQGDAGDDMLWGDSDDTDVDYHGNDTLDGGDGADQLQGDGGADDLYGGDGTGADTLFGDSDRIDGSAHGADTLDGGEGDDYLDGDGGADTLIGGDGGDAIYGDSISRIGAEYHGSDWLDGGAGNDSLAGGGGDDTLTAGEGDDALWGDQEALSLESHGNDELDGGAGNDFMQGQGGDDTLFGGEGNDWVAGGDESSTDGGSTMGGDDALFGEAGEDVLLGGLGNDVLSGGDGDDWLLGGDGDDVLEGGAGSDILRGGAGNDTYYVDATGLTIGVAERISDFEGYNDVYIRGSAAQVDASDGNLTLTFGEGQQLVIEGGLTGAISNLYFVGDDSGAESDNQVQTNDATGFAEWLQLNVWQPMDLIAGAGSVGLYGGSGNDTLTAATGAITLNGGWGDDRYYVKASNQTVVEYDHGGVDKVFADVSFTLGVAVEKLELTAAAGAATATGNEMDNELTGNATGNKLYGLAGNDTLDGGAGTDTMEGSEGDDTYVFSTSSDSAKELTGQGSDTIRYAGSLTLDMAKYGEIENLVLTGTSGYSGTGNMLDNRITGNSASNYLYGNDGNDTLDGAAGSNRLYGNLGDDTFVVNSGNDLVIESSGEGNDTVQKAFAGTLDLNSSSYANTENGTLLDAAGAGNLIGTAGDNVLIGNASNNTVTGNAGLDTLIGGGGDDLMQGGAGDDTYFVDSAGDQVVEAAAEGTDTVLAVIDWTLGDTSENLTLLGAVSVSAIGNNGANTLTGNDGDNVLDGKAGNDAMAGGLGSDTYCMDSVADTVTEAADAGTDTIEIAATLSLADYANVENLTLQGTGDFGGTGSTADNLIIGNSGANSLAGGEGNDTLDGGAGADVMAGGADDDTYVMDSQSDQVTELAGQGNDSVVANFSVTLANAFGAIENATLTGDGAYSATGNKEANHLTGNAAANFLIGAAGNDTLDGGAGSDVLKGGANDDTYVVDTTGDVVTEGSGMGTDTVQASVTLSSLLAANVENLTLTGEAAIDGTGNDLANLIIGNAAANQLDGGANIDEMRGDAGDDTYVLDSASDKVIENQDEGVDKALVAASWVLADNVENGELTGTGAFKLTGNALGNTLEGNGGGDDTLAGGAGDDTYELTIPGDTITETADGGAADTVRQGFSSTANLAANVENLVLTGDAKINGTGNAQGNSLTGNDNVNTLTGLGGDDTLFGAGGEDRLVGGAGNDRYVVNSGADTVVEKADQGVDTVLASITVTLGAEVEDLELTGDATIDGTGNTLNNHLRGNGASNVLDGGAGDDTLEGGFGDDTYMRDSANDVVAEVVDGGADTLSSTITTVLDANVEHLVLTGGAIDGTGNELDNRISGNANANTLHGGAGNDTLDGGAGVDTLEGGDGNDTYVIGAAGMLAGAQTERRNWRWRFVNEDFAFDPRRLGGAIPTRRSPAMPWGRVGLDVALPEAAQDTITEATEGGIDTVRASVSISALVDNVENLELTGSANLNGTGNGLDNRLTGNTANNNLAGLAGNDTLDGAGGADTLKGGQGDDTYILRSSSDQVNEGVDAGIDTIEAGFGMSLVNNVENLRLTGSANINGFGNSLDNALTGNDGNNRLDGKAGNDVMAGGRGNDVYVLSGAGDTVTEYGSDYYGTDTIEAAFTVSLADWRYYANVENVRLTGSDDIDATGSDDANALTGNGGANNLSGGRGNDTLDGGLGNDVLAGGLDDDVYMLDTAGDVVTEAANEGEDTIRAGFTITLDGNYLNVENVELAGDQAIDATGNDGNNTLTGNSAANVLDGGSGADIMTGGAGDDSYVISASGDQANENAGEGIDTVKIGFTANLATYANVENMTLTGSGNINANGTAGDNVLTGNGGVNQLTGGDGNDRLIGGAGSDKLFGEAGNDELIDDLGAADQLVGGAGADTYRIGAASAPGTSRNVQVFGSSDGDVVYLAAGIRPEDVLRSVDGTNLVLTIRSPDVDLASFTVTLAKQLAADGAGRVSEVRFESAPDVIWSGSDLESADIVGTDGDDVLTGSDLTADHISGLAGADWILGEGMNDRLDGGPGNDRMWGHDGLDQLDGGEGDDQLDGGTEDDTLMGGRGNDMLFGDYGEDVLDGGAGDDVIDSGGGLGEDVYLFGFGDGHDTARRASRYTPDANILRLDEGITADDVAVSRVYRTYMDDAGHSQSEYVDLKITLLTTGESFLAEDFSRADDPYLDGNPMTRVEFGDGSSWALEDICRAAGKGTDGNDSIVGFAMFAETLEGGAGNDFIKSNGGDLALAGDGSDIVYASLQDTVYGGAGDDALVGGQLIYGEDGNDNIQGGEFTDGGNGDDMLSGDDGSSLVGGAGNDILNAGSFDATAQRHSVLRGGAGADSLNGGLYTEVHFERGDGMDTYAGYANYDGSATSADRATLHLGAGIAQSDVGLALDGASLVLSLGGADGIRLDGYLSDPPEIRKGINAQISIGILNFSDGTSRDIRSWMKSGTNGADTLTGTSGDDVMAGYSGDDSLVGGVGHDGLHGGTGNDTLNGGDGNDTLIGYYGTDKMTGGKGDDTYYLDDTDVKYGGGKHITELAGEGVDTVVYWCSQYFASDSYTLGANLENLVLSDDHYMSPALNGAGNELDNNITGNSFGNFLEGNDGKDTLRGGGESDTLAGGAGADTYVFEYEVFGTDTVIESDATPGVRDRVELAGVTQDQVTFARVENNLEMHHANGDSAMVFQDWYLGAEYQVEDFVFDDGALTPDQVETLAGGLAARDAASQSNRSLHWRGLDSMRLAGDNWTRIASDRWIGDPSALPTRRAHVLAATRLIEAMSVFHEAAGHGDGPSRRSGVDRFDQSILVANALM